MPDFWWGSIADERSDDLQRDGASGDLPHRTGATGRRAGFFARTYDRSIQEYGLVAEIAQSSISFNGRKGTLRGLHYQASPFGENKLAAREGLSTT